MNHRNPSWWQARAVFKYSKEQLDWLAAHYKTMMVKDLTAAFNARFGLDKTPGMIKSTLKNRGIRCNRKVLTKGRSDLFSKRQIQYMIDHQRGISRAQLTDQLNRHFGSEFNVRQIDNYLKRRGIKNGRNTRLTTGSKPWNKGSKGVCKPNAGSFSKGQRPVNHKPVGHERIADGYILIKTDQVNPYTGTKGWYRHKHRVLWEQAHGPVPKDCIVSFIDGDPMNCVLENLEMISLAEKTYLNRNGYNRLPNEVKPSMKVMAKVITRSKAIERGIQGEK